VTFLFTDIEGSTRLWIDHPEAMQPALEKHDVVLRTSIEQEDGYVFATGGDGFSAAFDDPKAAVRAAIAAQRGLAGTDWDGFAGLRVRMALHSGVAHERDGDYFGPALNRAARILDAAHGGQVLVSLGTEELLGDSFGDGAGLTDLGEHLLKDLGRPERLFQLTHDDLETQFAPLRSLDRQQHNLPIQLTSFVGREHQLNEVVKRLHDSRLLTLTGVGGSGKTRLALQAAAESSHDYPHGVWLVELASLGDADLLPGTIGDVMGVTRSQGGTGNQVLTADPQSVLDQVTDHLASRTTLLVLDNCEHLITQTARIVQHLLQHCADLTVLATSREGLGVPGETLWQVPSLSTEVTDEPLSSEAVRLFMERAEDANPRFDSSPEALTWVSRICERLDGMPLAIELAAARARVLNAKDIAERLDDRFRLLTGGSRTALPRHQTLEATVDWSYDLMTEAERLLFQRLAAFRGGFTMQAAERVCTDETVDVIDMLDLVGSLVDKSMVVRDELTGRFRMLETLRQYALRRLSESDEVGPIRTRHAEYFADFVEEMAPHLYDSREAEAYDAILSDHDNLRAAMAYCLEHGHHEIAVRIAAALSWFWWAASDTNEGLEWLRRVEPHIDRVDDRTAITVLAFTGLFASLRKDADARSLGEQAIERARASGDDYAEGLGHLAVAWWHWARSEYDVAKASLTAMVESGKRADDRWLVAQGELFAAFSDRMMSRLDGASTHVDAAEQAYREVGLPSGLGWVLSVSGQIARYRGEFETEILKQREARQIFEGLGSAFQVSFTLGNEAIALTLLGHPEEAVPLARRGLAITRELALNDFAIETLALTGWFEAEAGNFDEALDLFEEAIRLAAPALDPFNMELTMVDLAQCLSSLGMYEEAARVDGFHLANQARPEPDIYTSHWAEQRKAYREALAGGADAAIDEGRAMTPRQIYDYALTAIAEARRRLG
jgi:predicted ATPase/class 3 adenylate cyclase